MGEWQLIAEVGEESTEKNFEVAEYVPPKFEVSIEAAKFFSLKDEKLAAFIRAKYTYGKPMIGKATVGLYSTYSDELYAEKIIYFNGSGLVEFRMNGEVSRPQDEYFYGNFELRAEVIEKLTGLSQSTKKDVIVHEFGYKASVETAIDSFTAGTPFNVKVISCGESHK